MAGLVTDFWCHEWDCSVTVCINGSHGTRIQLPYLGFIMVARATDCDSWSFFQSLGMKLREDVFIFHVRTGLRP